MMDTIETTLPGAWCYRICARTGWLGVNIQCLGMEPTFHCLAFPGLVIPVTKQFVLWRLPCLAPGVIRSVVEWVGSVSVSSALGSSQPFTVWLFPCRVIPVT